MAGDGQSMQHGMRQEQIASAAMQTFMKVLLAGTTELAQITAQAIAANPVLEELPPQPSEDADSDDFSSSTALTQQQRDRMLNALTEPPTLHEHLCEQIHGSALPPPVKETALRLIADLDRHGYFTSSPEEIAAAENIPATTLKRALAAVRDLEPAGVGSSGLQDSLLLQLERRGEQASLAARLLRDCWDNLVQHRYAEAAATLGTDEEAIRAAAWHISRLNPDPGSEFSRPELQVITPDLIVTRDGADFRIELTGQGIPRLGFSSEYRDMMAEQAENPQVAHYLSRRFREGRELIRAINERQRTILSVAEAIVDRQRSFFRKGDKFLRPLRMEDIAADTGLHLSTVSRAVNGKYLKCDFGVYELRSFFSGALPSDGAESTSAHAARERIRELVRAENPRTPLTDSDLQEKLQQEGIILARRTVAKYREQLKILPAALREQP